MDMVTGMMVSGVLRFTRNPTIMTIIPIILIMTVGSSGMVILELIFTSITSFVLILEIKEPAFIAGSFIFLEAVY